MITLRPLPRARVDQLIPPLVRNEALIALVAAPGDPAWTAAAAWAVARAAAAPGPDGSRRRVALVDLCLEDPSLHTGAGCENRAGIAEAFQSGDSLEAVTQDVSGVFFIPAGVNTTTPGAVRGHPRWPKLQAGFKSEGALLLVYLTAVGLEQFATVPDGVIVLSPTPVDLASPEGRAVLTARERGAVLLGAVRDRTSGAIPEPVVDNVPPRRRIHPALVTTVAAIAVFGFALLARSAERSAAERALALRPVTVIPRNDSGAWTVQLAAYGAADRALAHADQLAAAGVGAFVTPLPPNPDTPGGAVWYRVQAGAFPTSAAAAAARDDYWRRDLARRGQGEIVRAPYSIAVTIGTDELHRLRALGVAAVRYGATGPLLVGAFETPEQAAYAAARLDHGGLGHKLVTRTGTTTP